MTLRRRQVGLVVAGMVAAILVLILATRTSVPNPEFQGKRISVWFDQLCSGVFSGSPRGEAFPEAYDAFTRMGPDAVPYLIRQLSRNRTGGLENVLLWLRQQTLTRPFMRNLILPSSKRAYAAVALRRMGASAEAATPALMEAWKHDIPEVKNDCVSAMAAILYRERPDLQMGVDMDTAMYQKFEARVVSAAAERFPEVASALQIDFGTKETIAEPDGPANGSPVLRSETNRTSSTAGSRR